MRVIISALIALLSFSANAELKSTDPSQVCGYMTEVGMETRGWISEYDTYGCSSPYKELGHGSPLANNLAFYAEGNDSAVNLVWLVLNVNNRNLAKNAHQELLKAAEMLSEKTIGNGLPKALKNAIKNGKKAKAKVGASSLEVSRFNWPTGKGYEIKVSIK